MIRLHFVTLGNNDDLYGSLVMKATTNAWIGFLLLALNGTAYSQAQPWYAEYFAWHSEAASPVAPAQVFYQAPAFTQWESQLSHNWGDASPVPFMDSDFFAVRWQSTQYLNAGCYVFSASVDDGVRVFVDGILITPESEWRVWSMRSVQGTACVESGNHHIMVEYFERQGQAAISLFWQTNHTPPPILPTQASIRLECLPVWTEHSPYYVKVFRVEGNGSQTPIPQIRPDGSMNPNGVWANNGGVLQLEPLTSQQTYRLIFGRGADHLEEQYLFLQAGQNSSQLGGSRIQANEKAALPGCW